jgi:hypothetical protein
MPTVAEWSRRTFPAPLGAGGVGSIPANSDAQNVPFFRRWRFEMKLSPYLKQSIFLFIYIMAVYAQAPRPNSLIRIPDTPDNGLL